MRLEKPRDKAKASYLQASGSDQPRATTFQLLYMRCNAKRFCRRKLTLVLVKPQPIAVSLKMSDAYSGFH